MVSVIPVAPQTGRLNPGTTPASYYRLVPAEALPCVDAKRTVRQIVLPERWGRRHAAFMTRYAKLAITCYFVGLVYRFYGMVVPPKYSLGWWSVLATVLQAPSVVAVTLSLRTGILRQLSKSFEFWFLAAVNLVWAIALWIGYGDSRVTLCLINWLENENARLTDANFNGLHFLVATAGLGIIMLLSFMIGIVFDLTDIKHVVLFQTPRGHEMLIKDVLLNVMGTSLLLMARLVYRRQDAVRHRTATRATLCVTCRCRLRFQPITTSPSKRTQSNKVPLPTGKIQLECVAIRELFPAKRTLVGKDPSILAFPRWLRWSWYLIFAGALAMLSWICLATPSSSISKDPLAAWFSITTLLLTLISTAPFIALHQPQLLRRLYGSFDFVFLLTQFVAATLCVNHLMDWTVHRCAATTCASLWFYVIVTYDALTPDARRLLRWTPKRAAWLAGFVLALTSLLALELTALGVWKVTDRVIIDWRLFGTNVSLSGIPFVFSRLVILLVWHYRLVWRLASCDDDELIMLLGAVQYENPRSGIRRQGTRGSVLNLIRTVTPHKAHETK